MADRILLALPANSSNSPRTDRVPGTAYQPSEDRPSRITVNARISVPIGFTASVVVFVGETADAMVEQTRRELNLTGSIKVVGSLVGATLEPVMTITDATPLLADIPPGGWYRVDVAKTGPATAGFVSVKERVF